MISFSTKALAAVIALSALPNISAAGCGLAIGAKIGNGNGGKSGEKRKVHLANLPKSCRASNEISVIFPNGKVKTFKKHPGSSNAHFHGESNEDGSSFEYILGGPSSDHMFGSLVDVTDSTVSQFSVDALGQPVVLTSPTLLTMIGVCSKRCLRKRLKVIFVDRSFRQKHQERHHCRVS